MAILHALWLAPALAAVVLALIGFAGAAFSRERDAEPRPTREMLDALAKLFGWVLSIPLTNEQREDLERAVIEAWNRRERTTIAEVSRLLERARDLALRNEEQRGRALPMLHAQILADARRRPDRGLARWLGTMAATSARARRSPIW